MPCISVFIIFVLFFMLSLIITTTTTTTTTTEAYIGHSCPDITTFTPNSSYQANLDQLLSDLSYFTLSTTNGFYDTTSVGGGGSTGAVQQTPQETIYGLFLCRGDVSTEVCQKCVTTASVYIRNRCPIQKVSIIWYDECLLRYSNQPIFSIAAQAPTLWMSNKNKITEHKRFNDLLGDTMTKLASEAAGNDPTSREKKFAVKEANFTGIQNMYTLAQCTPDLTGFGCRRCLSTAIGDLPYCCDGTLGGRVLLPSCSIRYETYPFYNVTATTPPPPPPPPPTSAFSPPPGPTTEGTNPGLKFKLALGASVAGFGVFILTVLCLVKKSSYGKSMVFWKKETQANQSIEAYLENYTSIAPKRYTYSDIKKMTNTFKDKLGQGGYGGVYKGKLHDGRLVAVKFLNTLKGNGEEFINEVAGIGRTSHVNIVALLGFCFEGSKRALIYEFMSNGSLEKFIYEEIPLKENRQLEWETLYQIALGIARGLEYLHHGCSTRILHFDIKPHNILLDEEFCPKISDFGLAKLCPEKESIISMLGTRGTAGYIAPEVFCRNFGGVSHKSDVYSYGMMVLEMVGGRKNIKVGVARTSEIYFPHWIYDRLECCDKLELHGVTNEEENEKARKMILAGLWCIQTNPCNRPPISRVLDMLEGKLESLPIPPKPFLSSPPRVPNADSSSAPVITL